MAARKQGMSAQVGNRRRVLVSPLWIPAFAGMTARKLEMAARKQGMSAQVGNRRHVLVSPLWIPAFAGMTGVESGNGDAEGGGERRERRG